MNSMLISNPNMSVLALVFQNFVICSQSGVLAGSCGTQLVCLYISPKHEVVISST